MNGQAAAAEPSISKGEFAALIGVTPARVSQYISEKKLKGDALDGEGRSAKIRPIIAAAQLKKTLDITQRMANGLGTRLNVPTNAGGGPEQAPATNQASGSGATSVTPPAPITVPEFNSGLDEQIKRERLEQVRRQNRKAAEEEAARAGRLTDSEAAAQQMGRLAAQLVTVFEGALSDFANALASKFEVPSRDALHVLRLEMRKVRSRSAQVLKQSAEAMPATVAYEVEGDDEESEEALAETA